MSPCSTLQRALLLIFSFLLVTSNHSAAQAGHLDPTFGSGGIVTTDFGDHINSNFASANAAIVQPDGKIVVAGGAPASDGFPSPAVARYNPNGSLDTSFGSAGIVTTPSIVDISFTSVALQADGKIVAVAGGFSAYVVRYTSSGVLDSTFGNGGIVTLRFINGPANSAVAIESNGDIVVANGRLMRFLPTGEFDSTFGNGGTAKVAGGPATGLALLPSGKILVAAASNGYITQYDSNGALDTTFAINGQLATAGPANSLALLSSGDILSGGTLVSSVSTPVTGFAVSRYLPAGVTDASFGSNGGTVTAVPGFSNLSTSGLGVEPSGGIVILGTATFIPQQVFALARYSTSGQLDTSFGNNGTVVTVFGIGVNVSADGLTIQPDGKIIAVGAYSFTIPHGQFDTGFKIARYLAQ